MRDKRAIVIHQQTGGDGSGGEIFAKVQSATGHCLNTDGSEDCFAGRVATFRGNDQDAEARKFAEEHGYTIADTLN